MCIPSLAPNRLAVSYIQSLLPQLRTHTYNVANDVGALLKIHKRNLDNKQMLALLKFQTATENFDSGKGNVTE